MRLLYRAAIFAATAHGGQVRKYTGAPYVTHPLAVAATVAAHGGSIETQAAAILHDVLEDTEATVDDLRRLFHDIPSAWAVPGWVQDLSDQCFDGNRAARKAAECSRLAGCCAEVQLVKIADMIDNTASIVEHDPAFADVYLGEKRALVDALVLAPPSIRALAQNVLNDAERDLNKETA